MFIVGLCGVWHGARPVACMVDSVRRLRSLPKAASSKKLGEVVEVVVKAETACCLISNFDLRRRPLEVEVAMANKATGTPLPNYAVVSVCVWVNA